MARNGSGVYTKVNTFTAGNSITASGHNQNWDDLVTEITNSVAADGQTSMTGPLKASSGSAALPAHTFASDPDTGRYRKASNTMADVCGGAEVAEYSSTGISVTGDVNVTGTVKLAGVAAFPVPTAQIENDAVTYAKIQNVTTARLLGRATAGSGDTEEISLGTGLEFSGTSLVASLSAASVRGFLSGLELSNVGTSASIDISAGSANDVAAGGMMTLSATLRKTTSSWTVGDAAGGLDTGAIATNTYYHFYLIKRPDTGVVDVLISTSASAPTMPTNYTLKRRIGSAKTNGSSQWTLFIQRGDEFLWDVPVQDHSVSGTPSGLYALSVPTGVVVNAHMLHQFRSSSVGGNVLWHSPLTTNQTQGTPGGNITFIATVASVDYYSPLSILTNTSAQIRAASNGTGSITWSIVTRGWTDTRGK